MPTTAPYGTWKSPITTALIVEKTIGVGGLTFDDDYLFWVESRPSEGGRNVLVRRDKNGQAVDVNPAPYNIRTRVHEYGGGAYLIAADQFYFCNFMDQQIYTQNIRGDISDPVALTSMSALRYADARLDKNRSRLICVMENHADQSREAVNTIGAVDLDSGDVTELISGCDFYAAPRISPDGSSMLWMSWNHPNMPWDGTELWQATFDADGHIGDPTLLAGGTTESICYPSWSPDGNVHYVSDRSGWWNLYRRAGNRDQHLLAMQAEFGSPHWSFGGSSYVFKSDTKMLCTYQDKGVSHLLELDLTDGSYQEIKLPYTEIGGLRYKDGRFAFSVASSTQFGVIATMDLDSREIEVVKASSTLALDTGYISVPQAIEFPTEHGLTAHAFYYPPQNKDYTAPADERPPLLVKVHGGPTGASHATLSLQNLYWTSRGFAVVDINYGGSTGFGREYRRRLIGKWGIVDVEDTENAANYLIAQDLVDADRLAIRGGSAGGYTTLAVLTFRDTFKAGASYYGVSDLAALARDTHKFESRYLDGMIGPYPQDIERYTARSPIHHIDQLSCPVIFFQGLEDKVVPPAQAQSMVEALREKGLPVAYMPFEGEQHGFRRAENIKRALEAEFYFYSRIFGFEPADDIEPVVIENL